MWVGGWVRVVVKSELSGQLLASLLQATCRESVVQGFKGARHGQSANQQ